MLHETLKYIFPQTKTKGNKTLCHVWYGHTYIPINIGCDCMVPMDNLRLFIDPP